MTRSDGFYVDPDALSHANDGVGHLLREMDEFADLTSDQPDSVFGHAELAESAAGKPDIATIFAPMTATPRERGRVIDPAVLPSLSAREREVLNELARGATYADIAADLFVSENTVKTHVSSLYSKLAVTRRSEALAVARNLHLL